MDSFIADGLLANQAKMLGLPGTVEGVRLDSGRPSVCNLNDPNQDCPAVAWDPNSDPGEPIPLPT